MEQVNLPPVYRLVELEAGADAAAAARALAKSGAQAGTLVWADGSSPFRCAVVVRPGEKLAASRKILYVATLGLHDAIGVIVPADVGVTCHWPDRIDAGGAAVARAVLSAAPGAGDSVVPDWVVLSVEVAIEGLPGPSTGFETSLRDVGCADATPQILLEGFARHFLTWSNRWHDDGFEPIKTMWLRYARDLKHRVEIDLAGERFQGIFGGIDSDGALELESDGRTARVPLAAALPHPVVVRRVED